MKEVLDQGKPRDKVNFVKKSCSLQPDQRLKGGGGSTVYNNQI